MNGSIVWILNGCGLEGRGITGAPVRFHEISKRFAARGVEQRLMTTSGGAAMLDSLGSRIARVLVPASLILRREPCRPFRLWSYVLSALFFRRAARALPAPGTVVSVSDYFCDVLPARWFKRRRNARWIAWIHHCETDPRTRPGNRLVNTVSWHLQRWSFRAIAREADAAWINDTLAGDEIERRLAAAGMAPSKIRRMRNGLDLEALSAAPEPERPAFDAVMVGVRPNKGLHDIVPVWERVVRARPGATLALMGGMSGEAATLADIERRGLPVTAIRPPDGFLPARDYRAMLKNAKILFAPSHEEGWGIAVGEAMAAGLAVVAYDLPAYRKIYAGAYEAVPCFDTDAFARAVVRMLDDDKARAERAAAGREAVRRYGWNAVADDDFEALAR